ncbi:hypothetical protein EJ03DRAFT_385181 [Teratosphaeria nubilosa]|uniref:Uncharacterized protein n=1 Tax=Teratosphaeria nubilosa TaxID=161662 RepID=A0A6G1KZP5_9PEZI|nr:hypothetical protein EJ03DRAFT_385181 [Teratosphaeria nubilosa]
MGKKTDATTQLMSSIGTWRIHRQISPVQPASAPPVHEAFSPAAPVPPTSNELPSKSSPYWFPQASASNPNKAQEKQQSSPTPALTSSLSILGQDRTGGAATEHALRTVREKSEWARIEHGEVV